MNFKRKTVKVGSGVTARASLAFFHLVFSSLWDIIVWESHQKVSPPSMNTICCATLSFYRPLIRFALFCLAVFHVIDLVFLSVILVNVYVLSILCLKMLARFIWCSKLSKKLWACIFCSFAFAPRWNLFLWIMSSYSRYYSIFHIFANIGDKCAYKHFLIFPWVTIQKCQNKNCPLYRVKSSVERLKLARARLNKSIYRVRNQRIEGIKKGVFLTLCAGHT